MSLTILDQNDKKELEKKIDDTKTGPIDPSRIKDMYYEEGGEMAEIFPETTVPFTDGQVQLPVDLGLTVGETYIVKWNGVEYTCVAQEYAVYGMLVGVYIGNQSAVGGADTGEPFVVLDATPDIAAAEGTEGMALALDGSESVTASIVQNKAKIHKIPNKYLDLEWIPETVKADKTLYEYSTHFSGFPAETLSEKPFEIVEGKKYTVVWNDVEYVCIGHESDFGTHRVAYIGTTENGMWVSTIPDAVNTDVPFGFEWVDGGPGTPILTGDDGSMGYIRSVEKNIDVTVKVISSVETVEKLPEKFLPMDDIIQAVKDSIPTWEGGSY